MTFNEARKLRKGKSLVWFAGAEYPFIRLQKIAGTWMVVIEDEPGHEDTLSLSSVSSHRIQKEKDK